jgi:polysaccharide deacetylase family protein (PEP-CTERM system associated)
MNASNERKGPLNAFTVDLEDWYQGLTSTNPLVDQWPGFESRVEANTHRLLAILRECHVRATFFVLGYIADTHPGLVEAIAAAGHEIGVHGYHHRFVTKMNAGEFEREIDLTLEALDRIVGSRIVGHRAPYFSINGRTAWAFDVLESRGFAYDSSVFPTRNMLYGYPDAPRFPYQVPGHAMVEFPATTLLFAGRKWPIAGGFYNRALPYAVIRRGIQQVNGEGQPAIIYVHPWELDSGQRYDQVTLRERITHYYGRGGLEKKTRRLLSEFRFGSLQDVMMASKFAGKKHPASRIEAV